MIFLTRFIPVGLVGVAAGIQNINVFVGGALVCLGLAAEIYIVSRLRRSRR